MNLRELNQLGLFPGPEESQEDFFARAHFCQNLRQEMMQIEADLPFKSEESASHPILEEAFQRTEALYGIRPDWVPLFFSNYQLAPWHGGCAWIFQLSDQTPTSAFLQLRAQFQRQASYLGIYKRSELIAHELAHVGRMMYHDPQFEEFLAYQSANSQFRRFLGPVVQSSQETLFFILLLGVIFIASLALLTMETWASHTWILGLQLMPILILGLAFMRLCRHHLILRQCRQKLNELYQSEQTAQHVLYRLTDQEIRLFSRFPIKQIRDFVLDQQEERFRWRFLLQQYPLPVFESGN